MRRVKREEADESNHSLAESEFPEHSYPTSERILGQANDNEKNRFEGQQVEAQEQFNSKIENKQLSQGTVPYPGLFIKDEPNFDNVSIEDSLHEMSKARERESQDRRKIRESDDSSSLFEESGGSSDPGDSGNEAPAPPRHPGETAEITSHLISYDVIDLESESEPRNQDPTPEQAILAVPDPTLSQPSARPSGDTSRPMTISVEETTSPTWKQIRQSRMRKSNQADVLPLTVGGITSQRTRTKEPESMNEDERLLASEEGRKLSSKDRRRLRNKISAKAHRSRRRGMCSFHLKLWTLFRFNNSSVINLPQVISNSLRNE